MKALHILALILVAAAANVHAAQPKALPKPNYNFDYQVAGADAVGIKRVFDDGKNTVLILDGTGQLPTVTTADGTPLPIKRVENYAVLPGLQSDVLVYARGTVAHVVEGRPATPVQLPAPAPAAVPQRSASTSEAPTSRTATVVTLTQPAVAATSPTIAAHAPTSAATTGTAGATAATTSAASSSVTAQPDYWSANTGDQLQSILPAWSTKVQWRVIWVPKDINYRLPAPLHFEGDFIASVQRLLDLYKKADRPLRPDFYPLQRLVVITEAK